MKFIDIRNTDLIEGKTHSKGTWVVLTKCYSKFRLTARISFYEVADNFYAVLDESGQYLQSAVKSQVIKFDDRQEGNKYFSFLKSQVAKAGNIIRRDDRSL